MVVIVAAPSFHRALAKWDNIRRWLQPGAKSIPGLSLKPRADPETRVFNFLRSHVHKEESIIIWHHVINNSITHHPRIRRAPLSKEELLNIRNLSGIVYMQRNDAPDIYQYLTTNSGVPVIHLSRDLFSRRKQRDTTIDHDCNFSIFANH